MGGHGQPAAVPEDGHRGLQRPRHLFRERPERHRKRRDSDLRSGRDQRRHHGGGVTELDSRKQRDLCRRSHKPGLRNPAGPADLPHVARGDRRRRAHGNRRGPAPRGRGGGRRGAGPHPKRRHHGRTDGVAVGQPDRPPRAHSAGCRRVRRGQRHGGARHTYPGRLCPIGFLHRERLPAESGDRRQTQEPTGLEALQPPRQPSGTTN